ncbi:FAD/FMN-containing dehydrogenase [Streptomyces sp. DvalAA-14]|uniref:FAD-binding oxidoreductase n=1 Tax=unclassified Streptomyces TaxID=2593676 RepID=UPI00081B76E9|nr:MULTISPECIES: FAD-binding oxidoreductase [unclassified Streptomyces]MYS23805.1 FAD-binding protein [Streptomyces sp. SID4948]SCE38866.1 FAD/FMN-containing dehydrogenase [Streptomyces sp. DvalAA-14]
MTVATRQQLGRLVETLQRTIPAGRVVTTGPGYDAARQLWNGAVASRPGVIVRCVDPSEARDAVLAAREFGVPLSVRGGGHDWAGRALSDGGLTVDLTDLRRVTVHPAAEVAEVSGGATALDVARAAEPFGLTAVTGTAGSVGMAGLTLGGGYGPLSGRFGLAVDNLLSADLVLADGSVVSVDEEREPDLFWALRGGGGNFGLVTSMRIRLHRVPTLLSGIVMYPWDQAATVLAGLADIVPGAPDELTVQFGVLPGPGGDPVVFLAPTWSGDDTAAGERELARLDTLGTPLLSQLLPTTMPEKLAAIDAQFPFGRHAEIRSRWVPALTTGVRDALHLAGSGLTSPCSAVSLHCLHGAAARVPVTRTAFGNRDPHLMVEIIALWEPGDARAADHRAWAGDLSSALEPEALPGGYPNLLGTDEVTQIAHAYGPNTERLLALKRRFDPDHVFRAIPLPFSSASEVACS